jgi:uncharacterized protein
MLYDQPQLLISSLHLSQSLTSEKEKYFFSDIASSISKYLISSLYSPSLGAFFSSEDADSLERLITDPSDGNEGEHKTEGAYYVWEKKEIEQVLGSAGVKKEVIDLVCEVMGVKMEGNVQGRYDIQGELVGKVRWSLN